MDSEAGEHLWSIGETVAFVLVSIVVGFRELYKRERKEYATPEGAVIAKNVGAAFFNQSAADDLRRCADAMEKTAMGVQRLVELSNKREDRFLEGEIERKIDERLGKIREQEH